MSTTTNRARARRGQTAAILPSPDYPSKPGYYTDEEFEAALKAIAAERKDAGLPAVDLEWREKRATMRKDER